MGNKDGKYKYPSVYSQMAQDDTVKCLTYSVYSFNVIFAVLGALMFAMGLFILFDNDFKKWVYDLEMTHYWTGVYILIIAGIIVMVEAFFGTCGAYLQKSSMLKAFFALMIVSIILEIAGASYMLNNGIRFSSIEIWLHEKFLHLIAVFDEDEKAARIMNIIQEWVGCCGANGAQDYVNWNKVIPYTCYNPITGNAWYIDNYGYVGCASGFSMYLERMSGWIAGLALFLAFFQIFCLIATLCLIRIKRDYRSRSTMNLAGRK